jgi:hypothetical protein
MSEPTSSNRIELALCGGRARRTAVIEVQHLVIAGWTGRDAAAVAAHIRELAALGVAPPRQTPIFYRVGAALLTTAPAVEVIGRESTGEVEAVLFNAAGEIWVGLGSDHTDRKAETMGVTLSKQLCPKPVAPEAWAFADVEAHWDQLVLRSWAVRGGVEMLYQQGRVSAMRHPRELMALYAERTGAPLAPGMAMFCGTLAAQGGVRWADSFVMELEDPVLGRTIRHRYDLRALPIEG